MPSPRLTQHELDLLAERILRTMRHYQGFADRWHELPRHLQDNLKRDISTEIGAILEELNNGTF